MNIILDRNTAIQKIHDTLWAIPHAKSVHLFGSQANGSACIDSDYDILLILDTDIPQRERIRISSNCRRLLASEGIDADILVKNSHGTHFCDPFLVYSPMMVWGRNRNQTAPSARNSLMLRTDLKIEAVWRMPRLPLSLSL